MKRCPGCGRELPVGEFNFKSRRTQRRQVYCRECTRDQVRDHYRRNADYYIAKAKLRTARERKRVRQRVLAFLATHPCVDCGESDLRVLDFDHVDPTTKLRDVGYLIGADYAWVNIASEIATCVVRCANCHRRRTAEQLGWYRVARPEGIEPPTAGSEDQCSIR